MQREFVCSILRRHFPITYAWNYSRAVLVSFFHSCLRTFVMRFRILLLCLSHSVRFICLWLRNISFLLLLLLNKMLKCNAEPNKWVDGAIEMMNRNNFVWRKQTFFMRALIEMPNQFGWFSASKVCIVCLLILCSNVLYFYARNSQYEKWQWSKKIHLQMIISKHKYFANNSIHS